MNINMKIGVCLNTAYFLFVVYIEDIPYFPAHKTHFFSQKL